MITKVGQAGNGECGGDGVKGANRQLASSQR